MHNGNPRERTDREGTRRIERQDASAEGGAERVIRGV